MNDEMLMKRVQFLLEDMARCLSYLQDTTGFHDPQKGALRERFERILSAWGAEGQDWQRHARLFVLRTLDAVSLSCAIYAYGFALARKAFNKATPQDLQALARESDVKERTKRHRQNPEVSTAWNYAHTIEGACYGLERDPREGGVLRSLLKREAECTSDVAGKFIKLLAIPQGDGTVLEPLSRIDAETAIAIWERKAGRPRAGAPVLPARWAFLADLCARLGLGRVDPDTLKADWNASLPEMGR